MPLVIVTFSGLGLFKLFIYIYNFHGVPRDAHTWVMYMFLCILTSASFPDDKGQLPCQDHDSSSYLLVSGHMENEVPREAIVIA